MSAEQIARNEAFFAADDEKHFQASFDEETKRRLGGSFAAFQERLAARREAASTMENPRPHVDTPRSPRSGM